MGFPPFPESEYRIPFFEEEGFLRKRCPRCGEHFWTQNPDQRICGESPCVSYTFIGNPPTRKGYSLRQMRETFLSFFEKRGHQRIKPYPIVARWRDDLYFTDASIVDFQPYVTEGIAPPPANPLVISQPCLRFVDVDNVGLTFGRHLTIFEMGGAHAFNYPEKEVYWKDQTVRYHHEFVTRELGVRSEEVVYKEGIWSGGGNAGPDVESIVRGLEVATLVFMRYRVVGDRLIELPIRTVDTGYGMERYTWLSQGSVSCFHAVYDPILERVLSMAGVKPDERLLAKYAEHSGAMKLEKGVGLRDLRRRIAEKLGMDADELHRLLTPIEQVFSVVDHTKSLAFILAEGVVPSNVREGYLARLIFRRTFRLLRALGIEEALPKLVEMQIDLWSPDFPHLREMRDEILELLMAEEGRYRATLRRGASLVRRLCQSLKAREERAIPVDILVELYDSQGLPPDLVSEVAQGEGIEVVIPDDFYSRVASRHLQAPRPEATPLEAMLAEEVSHLPPTELLYYEDAYLRSFEAKVLAVLRGKYVILDRTAFYPEGGGQPADHGILAWEGGKSRVIDVQSVGRVVIHEVEGDLPKIGTQIRGEIDWERRIRLMRHHTATHILLGALRRVLGEHAWQAGAQKGTERSRLDVSHYRRIDPGELEQVELLANSIVMRDLPVEVSIMPRERAEAAYGFRLYQGGAVPTRDIRVVKIGDWDVEACGGTHCARTGEVGLIKIVRVSRIQEGVERVEFSAGEAALEVVQRRDRMLGEVSKICRTPVDEVLEGVRGLLSKWKKAREEVERLEERLIGLEAEKLLGVARHVGDMKLITQALRGVSTDYLIRLGTALTESEPLLVAVLISVDEMARVVVKVGAEARRLGAHAGALARKIAEIVGGKGGGDAGLGQGGGPRVDRVEEALREAERLLTKAPEGRP